MFSLISSNVTRAQLRSSSTRIPSLKIIGVAAITLLAAGNSLANAAENASRLASEQHAWAVVLPRGALARHTMDEKANARRGPRISSPDSAVSAWVIPTDENLMIARYTRRLLDGEGPR